MWIKKLLLLVFVCVFLESASAQSLTELRYEVGSPSVVEYFVDPVNGSDSNSGRSAGEAYRSLTSAWNAIPQGVSLTTGYSISILPGTVPESAIPNYMESRHGTYAAPIIIKSANGRGTVTLGGDLNIFDTKYLYLLDLIISPNPAGDA